MSRLYFDDYDQVYLFNDYAEEYVKADRNPYTGKYYEINSESNPFDDDLIEEVDGYHEEDPDEVGEQYIRWLECECRRKANDIKYIKELDTQYIGFIIR